MFDTICDYIPSDSDYPARTRVLDILTKVLDGRLYDALPYRFHDERTPSGEYIPLRHRRPSVRYQLSRIVVEDSVSLLFSEGHFPTIDCQDTTTRDTLATVVKECQLNLLMTEAATRGSIGSVAIMMQVLGGRLFFQVADTMFLTPEWSAQAPDTLAKVTERYKVRGSVLRENGYPDADATQEYWFCRYWDQNDEVWLTPTPVGQQRDPFIDTARSVRHGLGLVPIIWIRNLPGTSSTGSKYEGSCTFRAAIETQIEIDYQLSQVGRGLKYSSDPTLLLKDPASTDGDIVKGAGNALIVGEKGDARLLEIGGSASAAVIEYVRTLREMALESVHGNRASPDRLTAAQSGRALELMNQGLLWLADNLRITYGEVALLQLARMVVQASEVYPLKVMGRPIPRLDPNALLSLKWPRWYPQSADDRQKDAQTLATLAASGHLSRETAVKALSDSYDIEDIAAEINRIAIDRQEGTNVV